MRRWAMTAAAAALAGCAADPEPINEVVYDPNASGGPAELVAQVDAVSVGVIHQGRVVSVEGLAAGPGWRDARLRPRTGAAGPDGVIEYDMVAAPPAVPGAGAPQRLRAHSPLGPEQLAGATGVRVYGAAGAVSAPLRP